MNDNDNIIEFPTIGNEDPKQITPLSNDVSIIELAYMPQLSALVEGEARNNFNRFFVNASMNISFAFALTYAILFFKQKLFGLHTIFEKSIYAISAIGIIYSLLFIILPYAVEYAIRLKVKFNSK